MDGTHRIGLLLLTIGMFLACEGKEPLSTPIDAGRSPMDAASVDAASADAAAEGKTDAKVPRLQDASAPLPSPGCPDVPLPTDLSSDFTMVKACSPYLVRQTLQLAGGSLTIEAGTTVLFEKSVSLVISNGRLDVRGTEAEPVVFASYSPSPMPGDWAGLHFIGAQKNPSRIQHAKLRQCGWASDMGCIWISNLGPGDVVSLDHIDIAEGKGHGIVALGNNSFSVAHSTFAIAKDAYAIRLATSQFAGIGPGNDFGDAAIAIDGGSIERDTVWNDPGTSVVVTRAIEVTRPTGPTRLTLGAGMRFLFRRLSGIHLVASDTYLTVLGTPDAPVLFSSGEPVPAPGDWSGIQVSSGMGTGGVTMNNAIIEYAGGERFGFTARGGLVVWGSPVEMTVHQTILRNNAGYGIYLDCGVPALPSLTGTTFAENASDPKGTRTTADNVGPGPAGSAACAK